jgi:hypothetical protein
MLFMQVFICYGLYKVNLKLHSSCRLETRRHCNLIVTYFQNIYKIIIKTTVIDDKHLIIIKT